MPKLRKKSAADVPQKAQETLEFIEKIEHYQQAYNDLEVELDEERALTKGYRNKFIRECAGQLLGSVLASMEWNPVPNISDQQKPAVVRACVDWAFAMDLELEKRFGEGK